MQVCPWDPGGAEFRALAEGAQAALLLGVHPDPGLNAAAAADIGLLVTGERHDKAAPS